MSDLIKVADAWEKSRRSNDAGTYIVAVAGGMKFLLLRKHQADENGSHLDSVRDSAPAAPGTAARPRS
jgi:hypothetical protein